MAIPGLFLALHCKLVGIQGGELLLSSSWLSTKANKSIRLDLRCNKILVPPIFKLSSNRHIYHNGGRRLSSSAPAKQTSE